MTFLLIQALNLLNQSEQPLSQAHHLVKHVSGTAAFVQLMCISSKLRIHSISELMCTEPETLRNEHAISKTYTSIAPYFIT